MKSLLVAIAAFFKNLLNENSEFYTGVNPDDRPQDEKDKDYLHEERLPVAAPVDPFGNTKIVDSPFPYENQQSESSCVPHGVGLALAIERFKDTGFYARLAWLFVYRLRSNFPGEGCVIPEVFNSYKKNGAPLFASLPDTATEAQANAVVITPQLRLEAEIFKGLEFFMVTDHNNIATLAGIAQQDHGVAISIFATYQEWAQQYPKILVPGLTVPDPRAEVNHEICILPKSGFTENGKRFVTIQDSAQFGGLKIRHLSEDFVKARVTTAGYWDKVNILATGQYPHHVFTKTLKVGDRGDDVVALQRMLIAEGLIPDDCATGLFAGRTLAGVRAFQVKYADKILTPIHLTEPTSTFGAQCIVWANKLCP